MGVMLNKNKQIQWILSELYNKEAITVYFSVTSQ